VNHVQLVGLPPLGGCHRKVLAFYVVLARLLTDVAIIAHHVLRGLTARMVTLSVSLAHPVFKVVQEALLVWHVPLASMGPGDAGICVRIVPVANSARWAALNVSLVHPVSKVVQEALLVPHVLLASMGPGDAGFGVRIVPWGTSAAQQVAPSVRLVHSVSSPMHQDALQQAIVFHVALVRMQPGAAVTAKPVLQVESVRWAQPSAMTAQSASSEVLQMACPSMTA